MSISLADNLKLPGKPVDAKYLGPDNQPWASVSAANAAIVAAVRYRGLTINVAGDEYWWKDGLADGNLILKLTGSGGGGGGNFIALLQAEYDAIPSPDPAITYLITDAPTSLGVYAPAPASDAEAKAGTENSKFMSALRVFAAITKRLEEWFNFGRLLRSKAPIAQNVYLGTIIPDGRTCVVDERGRLTALIPKFSPAGHVIAKRDAQGNTLLMLNWDGQLVGWAAAPQSDATVVTIGKLKELDLI